MGTEDAYYEAMRARDHRFDGKFFVGVKTTGIYCRPICPAKPKRQNVVFFANALAAERAGFRPCMRCRPEAAPLSPAWIGKSAVVRRALKAIHFQDAIKFDEDRFAELFGVSARHLRRLFIEEIGKTPKQISFESRLAIARQLVTETALPMAEIALASGFGSIRRFNDSFKDRFEKSPRDIRRAKATSERGLSLTLPYRPPFDFAGLLKFYDSHRVGDLEWIEAEKLFRIVEYRGKPGTIAISNEAKHGRLRVEIDIPDTRAIHGIVSRVRAMFDLDSDPLLVANALESDRELSAIHAKYPGVRLPSGWDAFETSVSAILGQLVSVTHGRRLVHDLIDLLGRESGISRAGKPVKFFPSPAAIAGSDLRSLKTTGRRKATLRTFSVAVANGEVSLDPTQDVEKFVENVRNIPGIGPWTASYMTMKVLRHTDAFPETDLILARALERHPMKAIDRSRPWRAYVATLLWHEYSNTLKKKPRRKK